jgi:hypothetical protein
MYKLDNQVFTTSLYEIDRVIEEKEAPEDEETEELIRSKLLS